MWFLEKMKASPGSSPLSPSFLGLPPGATAPERARGGAAAFPNVLTPDRIPAFCIPPRLTVSSPPDGCLAEPRLPSSGTAKCGPSLILPHLIQIESAEEIPALEEDCSNSDPQSQAALSLPHFPKAQTSYGFCTLLESPHTRRKESIFHSDPCSSSPSSLVLPRARANTCPGRRAASSPIAIGPAGRASKPLHRPGAGDSDATSSTDSSPFSSPLLSRSPPRSCPLLKARSPEGLLGRALRARNKSSMVRNHSLSTDESSSSDNSPNATRRSSEGLVESFRTRSFNLSHSAIFPLDLTCGRERLVGESTVLLDRGGLLRLSAEYCSENRRLRLRLISAERLYDASVEPKSINCCITFSLVPGKIQKQKSTVIKRSRNPIFNEDFFFDGITEDDLYSFSVRMKAINKGCNLKRDSVLGESELSLANILSI
uniref:C2 calcium-dependent domain-containing protein 4C-like n=1 Tax=Pelodiscus sinensis TaxID=13735 RepID=K7EZF4_PELSI|nr:C2 calcium-dependent domain-containing protein 4C-like [Pelodiscus sinensis]|eukprot:XP_006127395.1 C2 calcium-dependent domain-containing protein 4C-like [Pelodiscus sinensis]